MATIQEHLETAADNLSTALLHIECARVHSKAQGYPQNWIDAINKAFADTRNAHLQTGNIATCILQRDEPDRLSPVEKES